MSWWCLNAQQALTGKLGFESLAVNMVSHVVSTFVVLMLTGFKFSSFTTCGAPSLGMAWMVLWIVR